MSKNILSVSLLAAGSSLALLPLRAQPVLGVQFGIASSPVQPGYNLVVLANGSGGGPVGNDTYTFTGLDPDSTTGAVTLSFTEHTEGGTALTAGGEQNRDTGVASGESSPYAGLYRSLTFTTRNDIRLQLAGLVPYGTYSIHAYSYSRTAGTAGTVYYRTFGSLSGDSIGASTCMGSVAYPAGSASQPVPTDPSDYSITLPVIADASGKVIFGVSNIDASGTTQATNPTINGFTVTPAETHLVFAHYMVCFPTYGPTLAGFKQDILDAQANGIDGFALNCGQWSDTGGQYYKDRCTLLFEAAKELGTGFKLFFSADMSGGTSEMSAAGIQDMIASFADHPNYFRYQDRPLLTTWVGGTLGSAWWQNNVLTPLHGAGYDVFFVANFPTSDDTDYSTVESAFTGTWSGLVDGMFCFGASGTPDDNPPRPLLTASENWAGVLRSNSSTYIAPVSPQYWGDLQVTNMGGGRRYMEYSGGQGLDAQWASIIHVAKPDWVELTTWNDWTEYTYFSPVDDPNLYMPGDHAVGFHKTHRGAAAMLRYYIAWYKTGVQPPITRDDVFYSYRTQPKGGTATNDPNGPVTQVYGDLEDDIYVTTMLTAPATLKVTTGGAVRTYSVGAGITHTAVPFQTGTQLFQLVRGSTVVWQQTGAPIDSTFTEYNYGYYTGSTLTTPLPAPTGLTVANVGTTQIALSWNAVSGAASYNVKRAPADGGPYASIATGVTGTTYTDSAAMAGTACSYVVSAIDATGGRETNNSLKIDATPGTPPSPWSRQDIGPVGTAGSSSIAGGVYTLVGGGVRVGSTSDAFHYLSQPVTGNCTITARVLGVEWENTNPLYNGGGAGIMLRNSNDPASAYAGTFIVPGNAISYQWRVSSGANVAYGVYKGTPLGATPYWLRIVRNGNTFTEYRSPDGSTWTQMGNPGTYTMDSTLLVGLGVYSGIQGASCVATFDNVSITTP